MNASLTILSLSRCRTLADIRGKIAKQSKRNPISRAFHAKNDSKTIASWRADLDRILLVFNVRSGIPAWPALTVYSQTELGLNTYVAVSDVRDGVAKTHTVVADTHIVVADTHTVVADTHTMVSDIRREVLGSREGAEGQRRSVSDTRTTLTTERMLTITQNRTRSANSTTSGSNTSYLHLAYQVNHLPRPQGPVSDVPS